MQTPTPVQIKTAIKVLKKYAERLNELTPTKRPLGYGKMTHTELCRWIGVTPHLFRNRKKAPSQ